MLQLRPQFLKNSGRLLQCSRTTDQSADAFNLVTQRLLISGQSGSKVSCLRYHQAAQTEYDRKTKEHHYENRSGARDSPGMQSYDKGGKYEAQENGQCDRDENFTTYIKRDNDQRC